MNLVTLAVRNVARHGRRSLLTGGVVVFGFAATALAGGFVAQSLTGLRDGTIRSGMGHLQLASPAAWGSGDGGASEHALKDAAAVESLVRQDVAVVEVLPRLDFTGLLTNGRRSVPFLGVGLDPAPEARRMDYPGNVASGRWLSDRGERGVVLGSGLAASLSVGVGDTVTMLATTVDGTLNAVDAEIVGLALLPVRELDDRYLATSLDLAADLLAAGGQVSKLVVILKDATGAEPARERLQGMLRQQGHDLAGKTWEELAQFYRQVRLLYIGIFGFMGIVLVVVVLLAAANTMMMAAAERTREIGTMRALGTRPGQVLRLFVAEGVFLAVCGCVAGALLSLTIRVILNHSGIMLPPPPGASRAMPLHVQFYGAAYAAGAVAMIVTLALASFVPAWRAARTSIVRALTHV